MQRAKKGVRVLKIKPISLTRAEDEDILYSYITLDRDIRELKQEIKDMMPNFSSSILVFDHNMCDDQSSKQERYVTSRRYERISGKIEKLVRKKIAIDEAKKSLSHREVMIFTLKYVDGLNPTYIAHRIGIPRSTFYWQMERMLNKISGILDKI